MRVREYREVRADGTMDTMRGMAPTVDRDEIHNLLCGCPRCDRWHKIQRRG